MDVEPRLTANILHSKDFRHSKENLKNVLEFQSSFVDVGVGGIVSLCVFEHHGQIGVHLLHTFVFVVLHLITENRKDSSSTKV